MADAAPGLEAGSDRACAGADRRRRLTLAGRAISPSLDFRRVTVTGHYLHDDAFAFGFSADDGRSGSQLVTPFQLDDGRVVLVDRGWMPSDLLPPHVPGGLQPRGTITLEGVARWRGSWRRIWLTPANAPELRRWYGWDFDEMAAATGLTLEPLVIVLERSEGDAGLPHARPVEVDFPNDHLSYAITWYSLAGILAGDLRPVQHDPIRWLPTVRAIRLTAAATAILVYALIVLGAVVRTTNSGLSCPDWPTCYGHWVPLPADIAALPSVGYSYGQVMLEWVHRLIAGVFVGPLVLVLAVLAFRHRHDAPRIALSGGLLVLLLLVQGALGGLTVLDQNSPWSVAIHLGNALLVLTMTLRIAILASPPGAHCVGSFPASPRTSWRGRWHCSR